MKRLWLPIRLLSICMLFLLFSTGCARSLFNQNEDSSGPTSESDVTNPPHIPQGFQVENGDDSLIFSWEANIDGDILGYLLYYTPLDENQVLDTPVYDNVVSVGNVTSYELIDLVNEQPYYFTLRAQDTDGNTSGFTSEIIETPVDTRGPDTPTDFRLREVLDGTPSGNVTSTQNYFIELTWTNPTNRDFQGIHLVRKEGKVPSSYNDGETVATGNISTYQDLNITPGLKYYYKIYAYDEIPNYSYPSSFRAGIIVLSEASESEETE